jgi:hypothetical protein
MTRLRYKLSAWLFELGIDIIPDPEVQVAVRMGFDYSHTILTKETELGEVENEH